MARARMVATLLMTAGLMTGFVTTASAEPAGLKKDGKIDIKFAGPLAFGPDQILFVGDSRQAAIFAIDTNLGAITRPVGELKLTGVDQKIAALLGTTTSDIQINDMAVQPVSGLVYLSVSRGLGPNSTPAIVRVDGAGNVSELPLDNVAFSKASLNNAPAEDAVDRRGTPLRTESITDLAYVNGQVLVAGLSNEEFASKLRSLPFPFEESNRGTSVEIYHGAHGQLETRAPVRTFVPFDIGGNPYILAAYTCTPLVKFPVSDLKPGEKVRGVTVAELGNRNRPLDLIVYQKNGHNHLLLANSARGVMKITTEGIDQQTPINEKVADTAGLKYETIGSLKGVEQLDKLNDESAIALIHNESGSFDLVTMRLP